MRKRYNQFTRGLFLAGTVLMLSVSLYVGKLLSLEMSHPQMQGDAQPLARLARWDSPQISLLPAGFGTISPVRHGEMKLSDYHQSTRGERHLRGQVTVRAKSSPRQPAAKPPSAMVHLKSSWRNFTSRLAWCIHGTARTGRRFFEPILSAKTG